MKKDNDPVNRSLEREAMSLKMPDKLICSQCRAIVIDHEDKITLLIGDTCKRCNLGMLVSFNEHVEIKGLLRPRLVKDNDPVNSPQHYCSHPSGIECIEVTEYMNFNLGNTVKYIWRADGKNNRIQDLEKARWYLDREIARVKEHQRQAQNAMQMVDDMQTLRPLKKDI